MKEILENLFVNMPDVFSQGDNVIIQNNNISSNTTRNMEDVLSCSPLTKSKDIEIKDPQSFLKDISKQHKSSHY